MVFPAVIARCNSKRTARNPPGYALLAVLWICAALSASTLACLAAAREAIALSHNRAAIIQAEWQATGCLARARGIITETIRRDHSQFETDQSRAWRNLDAVLANADIGPCTLTAEPSGTRFDINTADEGTVARALGHLGANEHVADSLAAAVVDWIDADDDPRPSGAERTWYRANGLGEPPNRPLFHIDELRGVRGLRDDHGLERIFGTEPEAIAFSHAPSEVLRLIPGISDPLADHIGGLQSRGIVLRSFADLATGLTSEAQQAISDALPVLARTTTLQPSAWILTVHYRSVESRPGALIRARVQRGVEQVGIVWQHIRIP